MSIKLMNAVWDLDLPLAPKMVLLSLADQANDHGVCWPAVSSMMKRCGLGERAVRLNIKLLRETYGYLVIDPTSGKANTYRVLTNPAPASSAGVHQVQGCTKDTPPLHVVQGTPASNAPPYIDPPLIHQEPTLAREGFLKFQSEYPKLRSMERAWKVWQRINPDEQLQAAIMAGLMQAKTSAEWLRRDEKGKVGRFIPHAWRFLDERQWEDDFGPVKLASPQRTAATPEPPPQPLTDEARARGAAAAQQAKAAAKRGGHG